MENKDSVIVVVDDKPAVLQKLPCWKCKFNYSYVCPNTKWCTNHEVIPYMTYDEYKKLKENK